MSATDELRALLDERGVEHYDGTESTLWGFEKHGEDTGIYRFSADEIGDGLVNVWMHHRTPKQAIEAALGRGTCHVVSSIRHDYECGYAGTEWEHELSCGHKTWWGDDYPPDWCPWCGAKVVD